MTKNPVMTTRINRLILAFLPLWLLACVMSSVQVPTVTATMPTPAKKRAVSATSTATPSCAVVIALKSLNLRESASEDSPADPQGLQRGDKLTVVSRLAGWLYVTVSDGRKGYVRADYVVECGK